MKAIFTVHAGEYLVGSYIENRYRKWRVWVPAKDMGIDLLVTDPNKRKAVALQVKFSKDFNPTQRQSFLQNKLMAAGWWTHQEKKIRDSRADFWVFVLPSFTENRTSFIIITPAELLRRLRRIHGRTAKKIHSYFWITKTMKCWEARGLSTADQELIASNRFTNPLRDFSQFLNAWGKIEKRMKQLQ
jgi:hypothetical protein